jgi:class 3 adenylate cyclase
VSPRLSALPGGTVTFVLTDVEDSTGLVQDLGEQWHAVARELRVLLRRALQQDGVEVDCRGEELFYAFARARDAVAAAVAAQRTLLERDWHGGVDVRVRMGLHTGEPSQLDSGYLGLDVHRTARICAVAHGSQVLVSSVTRELVEGVAPEGVGFVDLGEHPLKGLRRPEHIFQVRAPGIPSRFPPLRVGAARGPGSPAAIGAEAHLADAARRAFDHVGRLPLRLPFRRRPGFAELGWRARDQLPNVPPQLYDPLRHLAAELLATARTVADVDRFLGRIDVRRLERALDDERGDAPYSRQAARQAELLSRELDEIASLTRAREQLEALETEVAERIDAISPETAREEIDSIAEAVDALGATLGRALEQARTDLDVRALRLRRTRVRGVYRLGDRFVVTSFDELGGERRDEFSSLAEARTFRKRVAGRDDDRAPEPRRPGAPADEHPLEVRASARPPGDD